MSIELALVDAANNCARDGARVTITLKSGAFLSGKLQRATGADLGTGHVKTPTGWATFLVDEVAAVETWR